MGRTHVNKKNKKKQDLRSIAPNTQAAKIKKKKIQEIKIKKTKVKEHKIKKKIIKGKKTTETRDRFLGVQTPCMPVCKSNQKRPSTVSKETCQKRPSTVSTRRPCMPVCKSKQNHGNKSRKIFFTGNAALVFGTP